MEVAEILIHGIPVSLEQFAAASASFPILALAAVGAN